MAKLCVVCGSLCAYFLLFLTITSVSSKNDYHFYNIDDDQNSEYLLTIRTIDQEKAEHRIHRRDVENNQSYSSTGSNITNVPSKLNESIEVRRILHPTEGNPVINRTLIDNKISTKTKLGKSTKVTPLSPNATHLPLDNSSKLSANETVQQKSYNTTIKPGNNRTSPSNSSLNQPTTTVTDDLTIEDDEGEEFNKTLAEHNVTSVKEDNFMYYNSTIRMDPDACNFYWVDLSNRSDAKTNWLLSKSHRRAATVQLSFEFPFYGHYIKNVTIATGGFLYTGDYVHSWLAATQYIAPLMANFDTSISNDSFIRYVDNGTAFTVEWEKVSLQDKPNDGEFTFQTTLHKNGDIVFVYQNVPLFINTIEDDHHPVKVGLSDAYIIDRKIFLVRRKTIYEYHRINFVKEEIKNGTVIYLKALPTCLQHQDCSSCLTKNNSYFKCYWCPSTNQCSNGVDRNRQDWLTKGCEDKKIRDESTCSHISGEDIFDEKNITYTHDSTEFQRQLEGYSKDFSSVHNNNSVLGSTHPVKMGVSSIVAILFLIAMVTGLAFWILYAYRNPHTTSGQILIRYRPSQWRWRRGEARYTAATIHM